jgi:hypothetical protein
MTRYYRVDWVLCDESAFRRRYKSSPRESGGVLFPGPLTHEQACACVRKTTATQQSILGPECLICEHALCGKGSK